MHSALGAQCEHLLQLLKMLPKKRLRIQDQQTLGTFQLKSQSRETITAIAASTAESIAESLSGVYHGVVMSRRDFHAKKYLKKHEWLVIKPEGVCCRFCMRMKP